jgi:large subunit ribosomal protein L21
MAYAIISLGGKQYRVSEGDTVLVDRLAGDEGATVTLQPMLVGGDGDTQLAPDGVTVTARVERHVRGPKIRIGKYRPKSGYRRHTGFRSSLSQVRIETIGGKRPARAKKSEDGGHASAKPDDAPKGLPKGYADMTVADISDGSKSWNRPMLEAALEYERAHADRKGAVAAIESALHAKEEGS